MLLYLGSEFVSRVRIVPKVIAVALTDGHTVYNNITMEDSHIRNHPDWEIGQPVPTFWGYPYHSSEYTSLSSSQRASSLRGYPGDGHLNYYSAVNNTTSSPQFDTSPLSRDHFSTSSPSSSATYEWYSKADSSSNPVFDQSNQQIRAEKDSMILHQSEYGDPQSFQQVPFSTPPTNFLGSPGTSPNTSNLLPQTEVAMYNYNISGWPRCEELVSTANCLESFAPQHSAVRNFPSRCDRCNNEYTIHSENEFRIHFWDEHPPSLRSEDAWVQQRCLWEGCKLKNLFKTRKLWLNHAFDVHLKRFHCDVSSCRVGRFGSKSMLLRHKQTMHKKPVHCDKNGCQAKTLSNLCRKDKSDAHEAKWHGPLECKIAACPRQRIDGVDHGFSTQGDLGLHIRKDHRGS